MSTTLLTMPRVACNITRSDDDVEAEMADSDLLNWLTVREVTRQLDLSQQHVIRLIAANKIHAIRTKLGWLVDPASVDVFERERTEKREKKKPKTPD